MFHNLISIAKILNFHGIKGEAKIGFTKGAENRIIAFKKVFVSLSNNPIIETIKIDKNFKELNIESVRFHKHFAIVKFKEFSTINDVELYKGHDLFVQKDEVEDKLSDDEYLISDLIGMEVFDEDGACIGNITGIGENLANDLLEVTDNNNKKHLIPFVKAIVPVVDIKGKKIVINNIEGLVN